MRQELSKPLVDEFFAWLAAQAKRVSRKSDLGVAMAYMLRREDGFRLFLDDGRVDIDSNLVENAIRSPAMNRRNALFAANLSRDDQPSWPASAASRSCPLLRASARHLCSVASEIPSS
jgi:hypothetical protein